MAKNDKIIDEFKRLVKSVSYDIDHDKNTNERTKNIFRLKQFSNALEILKKYDKVIKSGSDLKNIRGIGDGIIKRIDEILESGKLAEIKSTEQNLEEIESINQLKEVYGIGDKNAYELVTKYKIHSVDELKKAHVDGKVSLNNNVIVGLKYFDTYKQKIPRKDMIKFDKYLQKMARKTDPKLEVIICGSYRRQRDFSNDIDCMILHPDVIKRKDQKSSKYLLSFIETLRKDKFLLDSLTSDDVETKYMGFCKGTPKSIVRRIDIRYMPYESYYSALLYFTGSGAFNQKMRQEFKKQGFKLNEYGLYKLDSEKKIRIRLKSEKDVFDILGIPYKSPQERN